MIIMKWILIAIFCFSSASAALVGSNKCTWGPAYWCQGIESAKKCNAVPHCARMWKAEKTTVSSTETCLICKGVVQDLKTLIASKKSQAEIKELGLKVCDLMKKEKTAFEVCNTIMTMFLPEIIQMIENEVDGSKICALLHMCSQAKLVTKFNRLTTILEKVKTMKASSSCTECKMAVTMVKSYISDNQTKQELIQFVETEVCTRLPGDLGTMCKTFVADEMPQVLASLESMLDPDSICAMLGMCPQSKRNVVVKNMLRSLIKKRFRANGVECQLCQAGIADIRNVLRDASIQKQITSFLKDEVCTKLGSLEITCQQGVDQYLPFLVKFLVNEIDPNTVCKELGMCSQSSRLSVMKLQPAKVVAMQQPRASPTCVLCEFVISKVDQLIGTNKSEQAITSALERVCSIMPQTIRAECDNFVDTYAVTVIKLLLAEVTPARICTALTLCAGEKEPQHLRGKPVDSCNVMVRYMHVLAKELHMSLGAIVQRVCNFMPRSERHACRTFVSENKKKILAMKKSDFTKKFHPGRMCKKIKGVPRPNGLVHLLGRSKCTYGPAYWCASLENARECSAEEHCRRRVWSRGGRA